MDIFRSASVLLGRFLSLAWLVAFTLSAHAYIEAAKTADSPSKTVSVDACGTPASRPNANAFTYAFTNHAHVPATDVVLVVTDGVVTHVINDRGLFAPGVTIRRVQHSSMAPFSRYNRAWCTVSHVDLFRGNSRAARSNIRSTADASFCRAMERGARFANAAPPVWCH